MVCWRRRAMSTSSSVPRALLEVRYYQAAQEYLRNLTDENHMEATSQAYQRKVTLESLDLVSARRAEVQVFNELKVPYYLLFVPDEQELSLYHHTGDRYVSIQPNDHGRYALPELELESGLLGGWVRYWFRGELLP